MHREIEYEWFCRELLRVGRILMQMCFHSIGGIPREPFLSVYSHFHSTSITEYQNIRISEYQNIRLVEYHNIMISQYQNITISQYHNITIIHEICHFFSTWHIFGYNFSPHKKRVNRNKTDFTVKQRKPLIN